MIRHHALRTAVAGALLMWLGAASLHGQGGGAAVSDAPAIAAHPRDLKFRPLAFAPPERAPHRQMLSNNVVAYMVEDHDLPLVSVTVHIRGGSYLEPADKTGVAGMTGSQMRAGGAGSLTAEQFDEELDLLALAVVDERLFGPRLEEAELALVLSQL